MEKIMLSHGAGGQQSAAFIKRIILKYFGNPVLNSLEDAALLKNTPPDIAFTTDSFVVDPVFFPGGNIGDLAVCGTVNDLAVRGARPKYISLSLILEEGLAFADLKKILAAAAARAKEAGVTVACGDTKVVPRGKCDKIFINTAGIGHMLKNAAISPANIRVGDIVIASGALGGHSLAVMNARHKLGIKADLKTDSAPLNKMTAALIEALGPRVKAMRDITRGGLSTVLNELAGKRAGFEIEEQKIPVLPAARATAALLGLDILDMANEGSIVCVLSPDAAERALRIMRADKYGKNAQIIGRAVEGGKVLLATALGVHRLLRPPLGDVLPRIC
ncbi:MAG: hydrogenase expression/formation protein HypE [Elusimicrobiota bacterium]|jgi:hydrogenase expression/formation protein HypE|nr:hydrogenase expression/formation protein HypE [Elusimicrobiota bacterium]